MDAPNILLVLCTCPADSATGLASKLVEQKLAACVNILQGARSIYFWDNAVQDEHESILLIKTTKKRYQEMETTLRHLHPYELPEIISLSLDGGLNEYLQWVQDTVDMNK